MFLFAIQLLLSASFAVNQSQSGEVGVSINRLCAISASQAYFYVPNTTSGSYYNFAFSIRNNGNTPLSVNASSLTNTGDEPTFITTFSSPNASCAGMPSGLNTLPNSSSTPLSLCSPLNYTDDNDSVSVSAAYFVPAGFFNNTSNLQKLSTISFAANSTLCSDPLSANVSLVFNYTANWTDSNMTNCTDITMQGTYNITSNITDYQSGTCFQIRSSNVSINCLGNTIDGDDIENSAGFRAVGVNNITIKNCKLRDFYDGLHVASSSKNNFSGISVSSSVSSGIYFSNVTETSVSNTNSTSNQAFGLWLSSSLLNNISDSTFSENQVNDLQVSASSDAECANNLTNVKGSSNRLIGYYFYPTNVSSISLSSLVACNASRSNFNSITVSGSSTHYNNGIFVLFTSNSLFTDFNSNENLYGILLLNSTANIIKSSKFLGNLINGARVNFSSNNTFYNNLFNNTANFNITVNFSNSWSTSVSSGTNIMGGPYISGNFWANPSGTGFSQTCPDSEGYGICNSAYSLQANNTDLFPLANYTESEQAYQPTPKDTDLLNATNDSGLDLGDEDVLQESGDGGAVLSDFSVTVEPLCINSEARVSVVDSSNGQNVDAKVRIFKVGTGSIAQTIYPQPVSRGIWSFVPKENRYQMRVYLQGYRTYEQNLDFSACGPKNVSVCKSPGFECSKNSDCCSNICSEAGFCASIPAPLCTPLGGSCVSSSGCCAGFCGSKNTCVLSEQAPTQGLFDVPLSTYLRLETVSNAFSNAGKTLFQPTSAADSVSWAILFLISYVAFSSASSIPGSYPVILAVLPTLIGLFVTPYAGTLIAFIEILVLHFVKDTNTAGRQKKPK